MKEISTDELLRRAALRLPLHASDLDPLLVDEYPENPFPVCTVEGETMDEAEARRDLIIRAVNSFEAMREALKIALHIENDRRSGVVLSNDDYSVLHSSLTTALAIAEGKEVA